MQAMAREAAVLLDGVSKTFGEGAAEVHALRSIDLEVPAGELTDPPSAEATVRTKDSPLARSRDG